MDGLFFFFLKPDMAFTLPLSLSLSLDSCLTMHTRLFLKKYPQDVIVYACIIFISFTICSATKSKLKMCCFNFSRHENKITLKSIPCHKTAVFSCLSLLLFVVAVTALEKKTTTNKQTPFFQIS